MARLLVAKICGANRVSRSDGEALRHRMEEHWNDPEPMVLDFDGVVIASVSFFDESFGLLALRYPLRELTRRFKVENINARDRELLNTIVRARERECAAKAL
ncbi:MAG: STAS-like domain-containing protein [Polyangiaceae bacterium]